MCVCRVGVRGQAPALSLLFVVTSLSRGERPAGWGTTLHLLTPESQLAGSSPRALNSGCVGSERFLCSSQLSHSCLLLFFDKKIINGTF